MKLKKKWETIFMILTIVGLLLMAADPESTKWFILTKLIGLSMFVPSGYLLAKY